MAQPRPPGQEHEAGKPGSNGIEGRMLEAPTRRQGSRHQHRRPRIGTGDHGRATVSIAVTGAGDGSLAAEFSYDQAPKTGSDHRQRNVQAKSAFSIDSPARQAERRSLRTWVAPWQLAYLTNSREDLVAAVA